MSIWNPSPPSGGGGGAPTNATYVTIIADATLTNERTLAGEATVVSITDGGAGAAVTIGVAANGITDAKLRQGAATSVIGRSANTAGNVADITTATDGQVLRRAAGVLGFGAVDLADTDGVIGILASSNGGTGTANGAAPPSATYVTLTTDGTLTNERTLAGEATVVSITDGGAGAAVTVSLAANGVTNAKLAQMPANTLKGNNTGGVANAADLTVAQATAMLALFTSALQGLVPASGGGSTNFLRADGTWSAPPGGGGGGLTLTTTEVNLGTYPRRHGKFNITSTGLAVGKPVLIMQAVGPYTGKGLLTDEAEMDGLVVSGKTTSATNIECFYNSATYVKGNFKFDYMVSA